MNFTAAIKPSLRVVPFRLHGPAPSLHLEGSLAGIAWLAPILPFPMGPAARRLERDRTGRSRIRRGGAADPESGDQAAEGRSCSGRGSGGKSRHPAAAPADENPVHGRAPR